MKFDVAFDLSGSSNPLYSSMQIGRDISSQSGACTSSEEDYSNTRREDRDNLTSLLLLLHWPEALRDFFN